MVEFHDLCHHTIRLTKQKPFITINQNNQKVSKSWLFCLGLMFGGRSQSCQSFLVGCHFVFASVFWVKPQRSIKFYPIALAYRLAKRFFLGKNPNSPRFLIGFDIYWRIGYPQLNVKQSMMTEQPRLLYGSLDGCALRYGQLSIVGCAVYRHIRNAYLYHKNQPTTAKTIASGTSHLTITRHKP